MKILFATDGFPAAEAGRSMLEAISRRDHEVLVLSVVPTGMPTPDEIPLRLDTVEVRREQARELATAAAETLERSGFKASARVDEGRPYAVIHDTASAEGIDLIVVGAGNQSWLANLLLGSVSTHLLHHAPCSVLVVHKAPEKVPTRVLIATDGSEGSEGALGAFTAFADPAACEVEVASVAPHPPPVIMGIPPAYASFEQDEIIMKQLRERADAYANDAQAKLRSSGFESSVRSATGSAALELMGLIEDHGIDLAVVGSRGLGAVRRTLLGSVSAHIARNAPATLVARS